MKNQQHPTQRDGVSCRVGVTPLCLSAADAAIYLGLLSKDARRIKYLGQIGQLPRIAVGKTFVYPISGLEDYVRTGSHRRRQRVSGRSKRSAKSNVGSQKGKQS